MSYYRLATQSKTLPTHHAYRDAWIWDMETLIDCREPGFQLWLYLHSAIAALAGVERDGEYPASEYPYFMVVEIENDNISDDIGEWVSALPESVASVRQIESSRILEFARTLAERDYGSDFLNWETNEILEYLEEVEDELEQWILKNAVAVTPIFADTLPKPD